MTDDTQDHPTDHAGLGVLSVEDCNELLFNTEIGRVAFVSDGDIVILPINYRFVDSTVVFQTTDGSKLDMAAEHKTVAFEIDGFDSVQQTGWSVLVKGTAQYVMEEEVEAQLRRLGLRPWAPYTRERRWVRILPDEISGRKIE